MKTLTITSGTATLEKKKKMKKIPQFENLDEEQKFLDNIDLSDYFNIEDFVKMEDSKFYKSFKKLISIRLPLPMIDKLKAIAEQRKIPYQKLIKLYINEGISKNGR